MKSYESIPVSKTEIDGVVEDLCIEPNYEIEYLSDHLDDGKPGGSNQYYQLVKLTSKPLHNNYETISM